MSGIHAQTMSLNKRDRNAMMPEDHVTNPQDCSCTQTGTELCSAAQAWSERLEAAGPFAPAETHQTLLAEAPNCVRDTPDYAFLQAQVFEGQRLSA